jgi:dTDP-4-amino-4,6-dideoxygalactose transaminase
MIVPFQDLKAQYFSLKTEIDEALASVLNDTAFIGGKNNTYTTKFEESFSDYLGIKHCISCANGTDSLEILLKAFGIKQGDEVIVPALTWISTSEAVGNCGAQPVFVDVHPVSYTLDTAAIESCITERTKAIIPVHLYGLPADMDEVMRIAAKYKLIVIEDCAQSHGARYKNKMCGTIGHAASFSFYPGKNLGAYGDAGAMVTNDDHIALQCQMIANHGQVKKHTHVMEGRNSRLDGLQAAVLSAKLPFLERWTDARIKHAAYYSQLLSGLRDVTTPATAPECKHVFHLYVIQVSDRKKVTESLQLAGIETAIHYPTPLPFQGAYANLKPAPTDYPCSAALCNRILSIPMFPELRNDQIEYVAEVLKNIS